MHNSPVNWYEGLFLRPHHFQAAERYWAEKIQTSEQWDHPYGYGLLSMAERAEIVGGRLNIRSRPGSGTAVTATIPLPSVTN